MDQSVIRPYYGKMINSQMYGGLKLMEATYEPNVQLPIHSHPRASYCLILKGGYIETYGTLRLECGPSHLKFQPAGESHTDSYGIQEGRSFIVELDEKWLDRMQHCSLSITTPALHQDLSSVSIVARLRSELHHSDDVSPIFVEALMLEVIANLARKARKTSVRSESHRINRVKDFLHDRFTERLSLTEIASFAGVHPVYLADSFRRHVHCSIGDYLRRLRVDFAQRLISDTDLSLIEISLAAGFSNQSHFTRVFKQQTGQTPARYRAMLRP